MFVRTLISIFTASCLLLTLSSSAMAEDFDEIISRAQQLKKEGKFAQALEELSWASQELEKEHHAKLQSFFPSAEGTTPKEFKVNAAMGMMTIERIYAFPNGGKVKATLTGSSGSKGGANQGLGALANFAQMAAMMDKNGGTETMRINGQRATLTNQQGKMNLNLPVSGGMFFKFEPTGGNKATKEQLVTLANGVNVSGLSSYMGTN